MSGVSKANFSDVYTAPDPRAYYCSLQGLDYQVPAHGERFFARLVEVLRGDGVEPTVLDLCCSYGVNTWLLNHDITFDELRDHYCAPEVAGLDRAGLVAADRTFVAQRRAPEAVRTIGLDSSANAVSYATEVGLLDAGVVADLEVDDPDIQQDDLARRLAGVDLVTITGGVGYVGARTFERVLDAVGGAVPPWVAALTVRWVGFEEIAAALERFGLVTETYPGYVVRQRRFADEGEREFVMARLAERGLEPNPIEAEGWHCAEMYLARPRAEVARRPLAEVLGDLVDDL